MLCVAKVFSSVVTSFAASCRFAEVPFSSAWKWSGMTHNGSSQGGTSSYVMGAPDILIGNGATGSYIGWQFRFR